MANLADLIEGHLKSLLQDRDGIVEVQRNGLADQFGCAPSQITYVLATRFTPHRGYVVESRRGGGGYVRVIRLNVQENLRQLLRDQVPEQISEAEAVGIIDRLQEEGLITARERLLMEGVLARDAIGLSLPYRDLMRARLLRALLIMIQRF